MSAAAAAQQAPFLQINLPNTPKGAAVLFEDSRGGLWLGGAESGREGLTYFDGSRFILPVSAFPKVFVNGMAEDSDGGLLISSNDGVYRLLGGRLERVLVGAHFGLTKVARDIFLTIVTPPGKERTDADLVRIKRLEGSWKDETVARSTPAAFLSDDRRGTILYVCRGGFCELRKDDVVSWHPGLTLAIQRHALSTPLAGLVSRDRFGCIWMRGRASAMVQCDGETEPRVLPPGVGGLGQQRALELDDGSVAIPSMYTLAFGRPGNFRVLTRANGYPSVMSTLVTRDGCIWLSNSDGLFVFPTRLDAEFGQSATA